MKKGISLLLLLPLLLTACRQEKDPVRYAEDPEHGLRKTVVAGNTQYVVQYKPAAYILRKETPDPAEAETRRGQLEGMLWFNIAISVPGFNQSPLRYQVSGLEEYTARQHYYLDEAPKDIYLLYGNDTLYVNSYWFENNQNLTAHETMVVGFRLPDGNKKPDRPLRFSFYDRVFRNGIIKAVIRQEDLEAIPDFK